MKKSILLSFLFAAVIVAPFLTGCGEEDPDGPTCYSIAGTDTGSHKVFIGDLNPGLSPIQDTLTASVSGSNVTIQSTALGRDLTGVISSSDCNSVALDSVIFDEGDTLKISSSTLPVPGGVVKIWNIRAGGKGTVTATGVTTRIDIAKGNTNITSPIDLSNLAGLKLNLRGTFLKIP